MAQWHNGKKMIYKIYKMVFLWAVAPLRRCAIYLKVNNFSNDINTGKKYPGDD